MEPAVDQIRPCSRPEEMHELLTAIDTSFMLGLRYRALIALMVTFIIGYFP